jgi:putative ABC transport system permease protein
MSLVLRQGMRPAVLGIAVGLVVSVALSRLLQSLLFGVGATDVATYAAMGGVLSTAALVACWVPARAALRLDPMTVLKEE